MIITNSLVFAHSGRTDSSGGHRDNKNKSGLGSYHYHCGGNPAHLHPNGICPYKNYSNYTVKTFASSSNSSERKITKSSSTTQYQHTKAKLEIDGEYIEINGISKDGVTLVELRALCDALGVETVWDSEKSQITCTKGNKTLIFTVDSNNAIINNKGIKLSVAPKLLNGKTLLPARFVAEGIGKTVVYNDSTKLITIY